MRAYKCDRCGAVIDDPITITIAMNDPYSTDPHYDLCNHCAIHYLGWTQAVQQLTNLSPEERLL